MMPSLKDIKERLNNGGLRSGKAATTSMLITAIASRVEERKAVLAFIREQATKGTADYEHKLTKLADAIERGEHE